MDTNSQGWYVPFMRAEEILETLTDDELREKADACFIQAENTQIYQHVGVSKVYQPISAADRQRLLAEADFYLKALAWRSDARTARRDFWMEVAVIVLIGVEIILSLVFGFLAISEGRQQAAILQQMNKNTADTAAQIQRAADATTASLEILRQDRAERAKKPRFMLYLGSVPIDQALLRLHADGRQGYQPLAEFDLRLKNEGEAPASPAQIHVLVPAGVNLNISPSAPVPETEEPSEPATRGFTYAIPLLPVGKTFRLRGLVTSPGDKGPFRAVFTLTTPQLPTVTPLGSLTVLPPKP